MTTKCASVDKGLLGLEETLPKNMHSANLFLRTSLPKVTYVTPVPYIKHHVRNKRRPMSVLSP